MILEMPVRKRREENVNRSETLVIAGVTVLLNDQMVYIRQDMNGCDMEQMLVVLRQIRRSIQIGAKKRQRLVIFGSDEMARMIYVPHFNRVETRQILIERLHAQKVD